MRLIRWPFEKFVDSPYYSESELCGGAVTVFSEVPRLASDALLTTLCPLLENVLQTVYHLEISCLGAPILWLKKPRNRVGRDLYWIVCSGWKKWIGGTPLEHPPCSLDVSQPMRYLGFSNHEKGAPRQEISKWSTVCNTFSRSEWSVVRSASLAKEVLRKRDRHCTSTKFQLGVIMSPRTFQTALGGSSDVLPSWKLMGSKCVCEVVASIWLFLHVVIIIVPKNMVGRRHT
jgi:hypothetical protein